MQDRAPFSPEFERHLAVRINERELQAAKQDQRDLYGGMLLSVASAIFPGVATAWAGAPEMVARHTVDIATMLIVEVDAAVDKKFPPLETAAEVESTDGTKPAAGTE